VKLLYHYDPTSDATTDFMEALQNCDALDFLPFEDKRFGELYDVRETMLVLDYALDRICALNPKMTERYRAQHAQQRAALTARVAALKLVGVFVEKELDPEPETR
jgi:hypothetical protein